MNRCKLCLMPEARPDCRFIDGVCSGCRYYTQRLDIDWESRLGELRDLLCEAKSRNASYDVVVPVSGGKDSTFQVLKLREMGAHILAVNSGTDMLSDLGRRNLDNLKRFCDVIEWTPCVEVRKKLMRIGLEMVGDLSYPEHLAIWAIPTRIAVMMRIPLVVWGEQPQREYADPGHAPIPQQLDNEWLAEFGGLLGLRLDDVVGMEGLSESDLESFRFPSWSDIAQAGTRGIWLGEYMDWDGWRNAFIAQQYGFEVSPVSVEQSLANYENLDNQITVLRDWLRFCKYG